MLHTFLRGKRILTSVSDIRGLCVYVRVGKRFSDNVNIDADQETKLATSPRGKKTLNYLSLMLAFKKYIRRKFGNHKNQSREIYNTWFLEKLL